MEFSSLDGMDALCQRGLRNLLMACADTKLLLGYHYGEWTFGTPELEAAVASCSLSQAELGHVRLLHAVLKRHYGDDPDQLVEARAGDAFANVAYLDQAVDGWSGFVAINAVVDLAVTRMLHAMRGSSFKPLRMSLEKMLDEERYHLHHGRGWFRSLARRSDDVRGRLEREVAAALRKVAAWFGPEDQEEDAALVAAGIKAEASAELCRAVFADVRAMADEVGVAVDVPPVIDADGWDPATRRAAAGGLDDDILFHLRGGKNELFKIG